MTRAKTSTPWLALFWGLLFLAAQAVSVAHLHTDEATDASCAVCSLVKSQTAVVDSPSASPAEAHTHPAPPTAQPLARATAPRTVFEARAPPQA